MPPSPLPTFSQSQLSHAPHPHSTFTCPSFNPQLQVYHPPHQAKLLGSVSADLILEFACLKPSSLLTGFSEVLVWLFPSAKDELSSGYWGPLLPSKEQTTLLPAEGFTLGQVALSL